MDDTEGIRRGMVGEINSQVQSNSKISERVRLEQEYGQVWDMNELSAEFKVQGFMAPFIIVIRKSTGEKGSLMFQDRPRFYFSWTVVKGL